MNRIWKMTLLIIGIILLDQFTKAAIQSNFQHGESMTILDGFFNLTYVRNPGAAFGFGAQASDTFRKILFLVVPVLACFWLIWLIWTHREKHWLSCLTYSLIFSGAVGNLIDRFSYGYVVDFFDFYLGAKHFPAFNIADSAISIGGFFLVLEFFLVKDLNKGDETEKEN